MYVLLIVGFDPSISYTIVTYARYAATGPIRPAVTIGSVHLVTVTEHSSSVHLHLRGIEYQQVVGHQGFIALTISITVVSVKQ